MLTADDRGEPSWMGCACAWICGDRLAECMQGAMQTTPSCVQVVCILTVACTCVQARIAALEAALQQQKEAMAALQRQGEEEAEARQAASHPHTSMSGVQVRYCLLGMGAVKCDGGK